MGKKKPTQSKEEHDADPSTFLNKKKKHVRNSEADDLPRSYKKIMRYQKYAEEREIQKEKAKLEPKPQKEKLQIKKGESLSEFGQRVNAAVPLPLAKGVNSAKTEKTAARQRAKADNLRREHHEIKLKRGRARGSDDEDEDIQWKQRDRSPDPWAALEKKTAKPKFGEVADRPPELPTLRRFNNVPKSAGSMARREMLEEERNNVIKAYRKMREGGD